MENEILLLISSTTFFVTTLILAFVAFSFRKKYYVANKKQALHSEILKHIPDLVWLKSTEGKFLLCNLRLEELFGVPMQEILGKTDYDFVSKELANFFTENDKKAMSAQRPVINQEEVTFKSDGHKEMLETIKKPIYTPNGKLLGVLGIARNITDYVEYERKISNTSKMLRDVLNTIPVRVFWKSLDGNYEGCNAIFAKDAKKDSEKDVIGASDYELFEKEDAILYRSDDAKVISTNTPKINYEEPQTRNGKQYWLRTSKIPLQNAEGKIYGVLGTYEDITKRKKHEIDLIRANENLKRALEETQKNKELETINEKLTTAIEDVTEKTRLLQKMNFELKESHEEGLQLNAELQTTNDELFQKNEIINNQNKEIKATLEHLKQTQAKLIQAEKMASLGVLTAGVAHEINNPLNYIKGAYEALEVFFETHQNYKDQDIKTILESIQIGIEKTALIVKGLNQFSRNNVSFEEECEVQVILDNCLIILHNQTKHRIKIQKKFIQDTITIKGNIGKLHQVFLNIITNAVQAIEEKGEISIETYLENEKAIVIISDSGCGIPNENLPKITDPFFTTKAPGKGTGLGLSIVFSIIQEHGGTISFTPKQPNGTTVTISLPHK